MFCHVMATLLLDAMPCGARNIAYPADHRTMANATNSNDGSRILCRILDNYNQGYIACHCISIQTQILKDRSHCQTSSEIDCP